MPLNYCVSKKRLSRRGSNHARSCARRRLLEHSDDRASVPDRSSIEKSNLGQRSNHTRLSARQCARRRGVRQTSRRRGFELRASDSPSKAQSSITFPWMVFLGASMQYHLPAAVISNTTQPYGLDPNIPGKHPNHSPDCICTLFPACGSGRRSALGARRYGGHGRQRTRAAA